MTSVSFGDLSGEGATRTLVNILCRQQNGMNVCHINARSLLPKIDEMRTIFANSLVDIIMVSESWLKPEINDHAVHIPGYVVLRNDRPERRGGGVAMLFAILSSHDVPFGEEYIFCEIFSDSTRCLVGTVYKPPNCNSLDFLTNDLVYLAPQYQHIIVGGDFNLNFLAPSGLVSSFQVTLDALDLHRVNQEATRFTNNSATLLDIFLVADISKILFSHQISLCGISDHDMIMLTYDIDFNRVIERSTYSFYDYKRIDFSALQLDADNIDWDSVFRLADVNDQVNFLNNALKYLHDKHVPMVTKTIFDTQCPWFSPRIHRLISARNSAYANWRRFRLPSFYNEYRILRNQTVSAIRSAKKRYHASILNTNLPSRVLWRNLKMVGIGSKNKNSCSIDPDSLNLQFASHMVVDDSPEIVFTEPDTSNSFSFSPVSTYETSIIFASIKSQAKGIDDLNPKFVRLLLPYILSPMTHICNTCFTTCTFPKAWKTSKIIPIPKSRGSNCTDFRPISILPFLSKVLEKIMHLQISHHIRSHNLLDIHQSGFRPGHSCTTALLKIESDIAEAIDRDEFSVMVLLDFSKAFDKVNHKILCTKLVNKFGFSRYAAKLVSNYLKDRLQAVCSGGYISASLPVFSGIPQGSILGPLLFSIFINDICMNVAHCKIHLFADDVQLYLSRPLGLMEDGIACMNEDLEAISSWSERNRLCLNPQKSKCLVINRSVLCTDQFPAVIIDNEVIPFVPSVRNLGVVFNKTLTWDDHIGSVASRIQSALRSLWATSHFVPSATRLLLARSLLIPIISFGCEILGKLDSNNKRKLEIAFNSIVRYIYSLRRFDHISPYSQSILGCDITTYLNFRSLALLAKVIKFRCPEYLFTVLVFARSSRTSTLIIPRSRYLITRRLFFTHIIKLWNSLPVNVRESVRSSTFATVRNGLYNFLVSGV